LTYSPKDVVADGTVVLRSSNIQNGNVYYADIVRVKMDIPENKMCHIVDILICARNESKRLVGKAAIVDKDGMSFGAFMAIFRSPCNEHILQAINSA
jgi:type I restriction enzyme S subunit